ncbi:MAG: hypothetical protein IE922_13470, partial [Sphingomonadales bacterium]|nr:hypothetical protein [Sphingomonadales bacterium]
MSSGRFDLLAAARDALLGRALFGRRLCGGLGFLAGHPLLRRRGGIVPGRFDRQIVVDRPERKGRAQILRVHARKVKIDADVDLDDIAGLTTGFTGADLANLINEAAILATRRGATTVALEDFVAAVERIIAGAERRSRILNAEERRRVAHHEMGHALVAAGLPSADPVQKVSIIPRSIGALGYTLQRPTEDRFL